MRPDGGSEDEVAVVVVVVVDVVVVVVDVVVVVVEVVVVVVDGGVDPVGAPETTSVTTNEKSSPAQ
jgi:hypothetical protein